MDDKFTITVQATVTVPDEIINRREYGTELTVDVSVNLTDPAFEDAVMSAAGRFRALKRTAKPGPRPRLVICKECGTEVATKDLPAHRKDCWPP